MTTFFLLLAAVSWALLGWFWWEKRQIPEGEPEPDDKRVSLLLRGINYLLSDEPDRALQELVSVARIHTETAEVYLALGGLFRAKGEIGRAVRIHQSLLARPDLPRNLHIQACLALGLDYQAGGFLDRSLRQFAKVIEMQPDNTQALEASLRIREQSHEWILAEELLRRLDEIRRTRSTLHLAYLQAEVAREYFEKGDTETAVSEADKAIGLDENCASAHLLLTDIYLRQHDTDRALGSMKRLSQVASQHLPLLVPTLVNYREVYEKGGFDFLLSCWKETRNEALALAWLEAEYEAGGSEAATRLIRRLEYEPEHLRSCLQLLALTGQQRMKNLQRCAVEWYRNAKHYVCSECGVEVASMRWQCPQCHHWGSMTPIMGANKL
jgi:lipopolysaccharide biosynthesis regulator YciM